MRLKGRGAKMSSESSLMEGQSPAKRNYSNMAAENADKDVAELIINEITDCGSAQNSLE